MALSPGFEEGPPYFFEQKKDSFMGTDFTYEDMGDRDVDDYTYKHLGTEVLDGIECFILKCAEKRRYRQKNRLWSRRNVGTPDIWMGSR
jgi:hypothetical protein